METPSGAFSCPPAAQKTPPPRPRLSGGASLVLPGRRGSAGGAPGGSAQGRLPPPGPAACPGPSPGSPSPRGAPPECQEGPKRSPPTVGRPGGREAAQRAARPPRRPPTRPALLALRFHAGGRGGAVLRRPAGPSLLRRRRPLLSPLFRPAPPRSSRKEGRKEAPVALPGAPAQQVPPPPPPPCPCQPEALPGRGGEGVARLGRGPLTCPAGLREKRRESKGAGGLCLPGLLSGGRGREGGGQRPSGAFPPSLFFFLGGGTCTAPGLSAIQEEEEEEGPAPIQRAAVGGAWPPNPWACKTDWKGWPEPLQSWEGSRARIVPVGIK